MGNDKKLHVVSQDLSQTLPTEDDPITDFELPLHKDWVVMASSNGTVRAAVLGQEETVRLVYLVT